VIKLTNQNDKLANPDIGNWVRVASVDETHTSAVRGIEVNGYELALYNIEGEIYCTSNICTHAYALLSDGFLEGDEIECPLHAGRFHIPSGKALCAPATENLTVYETRVSGTDVFVLLPASCTK